MTAEVRSAFITGASSGIGRSYAEEIARAGSLKELHLAGRDREGLSATAEAVRRSRPDVSIHLHTADLTSERDREALLRALDRAGLDLIVFNAGGGAFGPFLDSDWATEE